MTRTKACGLAALVAAGGIVAACVGDEPAVSTTGNDAGTGSDGSSAPDVQSDTAAPPADAGGGGDGGSSTACGSPAKDCLGGDCKNGVCQPKKLATGLQHPNALALDGTTLYWVNVGNVIAGGAVCDPSNPAGSVMAIDVDGTNQRTLTQGVQTCPASVTVDASKVYWSVWGPTPATSGEIWAAAKTNGANAAKLFGSLTRPNALHIDGTGMYWIAIDSGGAALDGAVQYGPLVGGTPTTLVTGLSTNNGLAVGATSVYFASSTGIREIAKTAVADAGPDAAPLTTGEPGAHQLQLRSNVLYWADEPSDAGGLESYDLAASAKKEIIALALGARGYAFDGAAFYFSQRNGTISKVLATGGAPLPIATGQSPNALVVDDKALYWTNFESGEVMKLAK